MNSEKKSFEEYIFILQNSQLNLLKIDSKLMLKFVKNRGTIWTNCGAILVQILVHVFWRHEWSKSWCDFKNQV